MYQEKFVIWNLKPWSKTFTLNLNQWFPNLLEAFPKS